VRPWNTAHVVDREADALTARTREQHVVALGAYLHVDDRFAVVELHRDDAGAAHVDEVGKLVAPHRAPIVANITSSSAQDFSSSRQRHNGRDQFALLERENVYQRLAARLRAAGGMPPQIFSL